MMELLACGMQTQNPKQMSPLSLAFLGDAVYELCVRRSIVEQGDCPVGRMNEQKVGMVKAAAQSAAYEAISQMLSEEETAIYKRGRNASSNAPKNAQVADYRRATGVETLFGYLYLKGEIGRIEELFARMTTRAQEENEDEQA